MANERIASRKAALLAGVMLAVTSASAGAGPPTGRMATPALSCSGSSATWIQLQICAGETGAPAGVTVQWVTAWAFALGPDGVQGTDDDFTWPDSEEMCAASLSGMANESTFDLGPFECMVVQFGDNLFDLNGASSNCAGIPLECGTEYVFRGFAHARPGLQRSFFSDVLTCSTLPCTGDPGCTYTQGYWKTHGPEGCATGNNTNSWPVTSLQLGNRWYSDLDLCSILNTPAGGNGLLALAHQLIAAKLNIEAGADDAAVSSAIAAADALIGDNVVGVDFLGPSVTSALTTALDAFNNGLTGPGHCS